MCEFWINNPWHRARGISLECSLHSLTGGVLLESCEGRGSFTVYLPHFGLQQQAMVQRYTCSLASERILKH